jgi:adenylate cyclase
MSRLFKAVLLGLFIGIAGLVLSPLRFMQIFEENAGLELLFKIRGARQAISDVVIVSIDKDSSENLNLPDNPDKWPRSLHARLTEKLAREGAKVIAFDVHFIEPRSPQDDQLFAGAVRKAGNVVLCEPLKFKEVALSGPSGEYDENHNIVQIVQPLDIFSRSAVATAPFTLPRIPFKVSRYWTFETEAGDSPTMPAVVLQLFGMETYGDFVRLIEKVSPKQAGKLPADAEQAIKAKGIKELMKDIRQIFEREPSIADRMIKEVESSEASNDEKKQRLIKSLIKMYAGANTRYINYYGFPGTVTTVPYYRALQPRKEVDRDKQIDVKDKAVFVGLSEVLLAERKDSFYTVFSRANGTFIGGVEIMATAFSNLLSDRPVNRAGALSFFLIIIFWGIFLGVLCRMLPLAFAAGSAVVLSVLYLTAAAFQFKNYDTWYPIVIPLFVQAPFAFFGAVVWNYIDTSKELKNVRSAFGHYLPEDVVNQLAKDVAYIETGSKVIDGICLMTDAQQYTSLSETMGPHELRGFMNRYYETMFKPVKQHGGVVSGVTGDAMLALWVAARADTALKNKACCAALDINKAMQEFKQKGTDTINIKTRIGVHYGQIILSNIGALDHYQYTPMGDIVNTASRIEGLNKYLGTNLLVSEEVLHKLDGFLVRDVGKFRLKGKVKPIAAYELIGRLETAEEKKKTACAVFAEGLSAFTRKSWDEARERFKHTIELLGTDGPSRFYLELVKDYEMNPPAEPWDGVIQMEKK